MGTQPVTPPQPPWPDRVLLVASLIVLVAIMFAIFYSAGVFR